MKSYFDKKVIVVTGGNSGIGKELCTQLNNLGAIVYSLDLKDDKATKDAMPKGVTLFKLDITKPADFKRVINKVLKDKNNTAGVIDIAFNNAGISGVEGEERDFLSFNNHEKVIELNFKATLRGIKIILDVMKNQGHGQIVNMASLAGLVGHPLNAIYSAVKSGLITYSELLRVQEKKHGIKVNVVCPGIINTDLVNNMKRIGSNGKDVPPLEPPLPPIEVEKAIHTILKGIQKNKLHIIFPVQGKLLLRLKKMSIGLKMILADKPILKEHRK